MFVGYIKVLCVRRSFYYDSMTCQEVIANRRQYPLADARQLMLKHDDPRVIAAVNAGNKAVNKDCDIQRMRMRQT